MQIFTPLFAAGLTFGRNLVGIMLKPYESYRRIVNEGTLWELVFIGLLVESYFVLASTVRVAAFRPYLLTKQFLLLTSGAVLGYLLINSLLLLLAGLFKAQINRKGLLLGWGYSLIPTTGWFYLTSLLYLILPPPRTSSLAGITFSLLYLIICLTLLFWKTILVYLTIRFSTKLDLGKISLSLLFISPVVAGYSYWLYKLGIFRVPFI